MGIAIRIFVKNKTEGGEKIENKYKIIRLFTFNQSSQIAIFVKETRMILQQSYLIVTRYLIPADSGVLNSNMTELVSTLVDAETISLILLSILVSSASFAAVTPSFVLKNMLPNAPWRC